MQLFLVRIQENTDQKLLCLWTLFTQYIALAKSSYHLVKKKNPKLNPVIRRVNDQLCKLCEINGFLLINNDMITTDHLWRDGIPLQDIGTNILSRNFYLVFHDFLYENHSWQQNLNKASEFVFDSDLKGLSKLRKDDPDNPIIGYLNINFLKEKNI